MSEIETPLVGWEALDPIKWLRNHYIERVNRVRASIDTTSEFRFEVKPRKIEFWDDSVVVAIPFGSSREGLSEQSKLIASVVGSITRKIPSILAICLGSYDEIVGIREICSDYKGKWIGDIESESKHVFQQVRLLPYLVRSTKRKKCMVVVHAYRAFTFLRLIKRHDRFQEIEWRILPVLHPIWKDAKQFRRRSPAVFQLIESILLIGLSMLDFMWPIIERFIPRITTLD